MFLLPPFLLVLLHRAGWPPASHAFSSRPTTTTNTTTTTQYLKGFIYTTGVMQTAEALERVAYEFAVDNFSEEVHYFEVRFAPQLHATVVVAGDGDKLDVTAVLRSVNTGLLRASAEFNSRPEVVSGAMPRYCLSLSLSVFALLN